MTLFSVESPLAIPRVFLIEMNLLLHQLDMVPFSQLVRSLRGMFGDVARVRLDANLAALEHEEVDELVAEIVHGAEFLMNIRYNDQWYSIPLAEDLCAERLIQLMGQSMCIVDPRSYTIIY